MRENLNLCPCQIEAKHTRDYKPRPCGCTGVDPLYRQCKGNYQKYCEAKMKDLRLTVDRLTKAGL